MGYLTSFQFLQSTYSHYSLLPSDFYTHLNQYSIDKCIFYLQIEKHLTNQTNASLLQWADEIFTEKNTNKTVTTSQFWTKELKINVKDAFWKGAFFWSTRFVGELN